MTTVHQQNGKPEGSLWCNILIVATKFEAKGRYLIEATTFQAKIWQSHIANNFMLSENFQQQISYLHYKHRVSDAWHKYTGELA